MQPRAGTSIHGLDFLTMYLERVCLDVLFEG